MTPPNSCLLASGFSIPRWSDSTSVVVIADDVK